MKTFEYSYHRIKSSDPEHYIMVNELIERGKDGWEAYATFIDQTGYLVTYLKKELPSDREELDELEKEILGEIE